MQSLADNLPPEIARQIHPDWRKNEAAYWAARDQLLSQYRDQWIGFANGAVVASGNSPVAVFHAAETSGQYPFVTCVGHEDEPTRMRRVGFAYDGSYPGEPLPILNLEFRPASKTPGVILDRVIADTGQTPVRSLGPIANDFNSVPPRAAQAGWVASRAPRRQPFTFESGFTWMGKNTRVGCKPTSLATNAFSAETC
ncbi:MAG: hypothetical protein JNM56_07185 [Planctomycetia bacterium]|nr:hypothetical protein [Planctomycetia bacterium]